MTDKILENCTEHDDCSEKEAGCIGRCMSNSEFLYEYFNSRGLIEKAKKKIFERGNRLKKSR